MLGQKIAYNTIISAASRIVGLVISLTTLGLVTRYLGQVGYGYYATILAFLYFFTIFADLGLYSICVREISRPGADEVKIASNAFSLRLLAGLLIFGLSPIVVYFFPYPNQVKWGVLIAAAGFWFLSSQQVLMGVFQKYLKMSKVALAELAGRVLQLALVGFFIWRGFGFLFIVSAFVGGALVNFLLIVFFSRKYIPIRLSFDFPYWQVLLKESFPLGMAAIFTLIYFKLDTIMLSLMKSPAEVGIYNLAYKILESLLFFPAMFIGLIMPLLSKYAFSNKIQFRKISQRSLDTLLIFIVPLIIGTFFLSSKFITLIAGDRFILSAEVMNILIIATGIIFLAVLFSNMIIALKKQKSLTYIYAFGALLNFIANLILIPKYSYYGAAWTTVLTELVVTVLMLVVLFRGLGQLPSFKLLFRYLIAGAAMAGLLLVLSNGPLVIVLFLAILGYFIVLWLAGGLVIKEVLSLVKKEV